MIKQREKIMFPVYLSTCEKMETGIVYEIYNNGIFEKRMLPGDGFVSTKIDGIKGLPVGKEEIRFLKKKIPITIFWEIVHFFRETNKHLKSKLEAYTVIAYNQETGKYFLWTPLHVVSMGSVKYDIEKFYKLLEHQHCYIVADFHLHPGEMGAFWSNTDNKDDCRDRFSGVIGRLDQVIPDYKVRFAAGSKHFELSLDDIFSSETDDYKYDVSLGLSQIKERESDTFSGYDYPFSGSKTGYVPGGGKTLFEMVKEKKGNGFSIKDLLGENW